jgi:NADH:ubiquinone oxidoreductase subunit K
MLPVANIGLSAILFTIGALGVLIRAIPSLFLCRR